MNCKYSIFSLLLIVCVAIVSIRKTKITESSASFLFDNLSPKTVFTVDFGFRASHPRRPRGSK